MGAELKAYLEAMEQRLATKADLNEMQRENQEQFAALRAGIWTVDTKIDALTDRVNEGFGARKTDEDLALTEIERLKTRVAVLEKQKPKQ